MSNAEHNPDCDSVLSASDIVAGITSKPCNCRSSTRRRALASPSLPSLSRLLLAWERSELGAAARCERHGEVESAAAARALAEEIAAHRTWLVDALRQEPVVMRDGAASSAAVDFVTFVQEASVSRANRWHDGDFHQWSGLEWAGAMCGEAGEAANVAKKLRRVELALEGNSASEHVLVPEELRTDLARVCLANRMIMYRKDKIEERVRAAEATVAALETDNAAMLRELAAMLPGSMWADRLTLSESPNV